MTDRVVVPGRPPAPTPGSGHVTGGPPAGVPVWELATALNTMTDAALRLTFAGQTPATAEDALVDTLLAVWVSTVYGTPGAP